MGEQPLEIKSIQSFLSQAQKNCFILIFFRNFTMQICKLFADLHGKIKLCTFNEKQKKKSSI
jgi:hypothetical protein